MKYDVDTIRAGGKMNGLVAQEIMEWKKPAGDPDKENEYEPLYAQRTDPSGITACEFMGYRHDSHDRIVSSAEFNKMFRWLRPDPTHYVRVGEIPNYSGSLDWAINVAEKVCSKIQALDTSHCFSLNRFGSGKWMCEFKTDPKAYWMTMSRAFGDTAAEAICKAALEAIADWKAWVKLKLATIK